MPASLTDQPLLPRIASGDAAAVEAFLDAYGALVSGLARRFVQDSAERDDAVQDVFVDLWKNAARFDASRSSEPAFVTMVARRRLIDRSRRKGRRAQTEDLEAAGEVASVEPGVVERVEAADEAARAREALGHLRPEERRVLELSIWEGMSQTEIAAQLEMPLGTVKTHARRGMIRVRESLERSSTPAR